MKRYLTLFLLFSLWLQLSPSGGNAAGITNYPQLNSPDFWCNLSPENDAIVMQPEQIRKFNHKVILKSPSVYDLTDYPATISNTTLTQWLNVGDVLNDTLYQDGNAIGWQEKQSLLNERNLNALQAQNSVTYGVTIRRTNLRTLPTASGLFDSPSDTEFDVLQETAIDPAEPVIILHSSASGEFKFIQMRNYRGWVATEDIAITSQPQWLRYVTPSDFLVVIDHYFTITNNNEQLLYQMGAKIPLKHNNNDSYTVYIPTRDNNGKLVEIEKNLPYDSALHVGFLPYTRNQIIKQSFKFLHDPYGWGGLKNSVDCSSFVADVYRSVGIELPRNADEQESTAGITVPLSSLDITAKLQSFNKLQSGDVLFFNGHTMIYLGQTQQTPYIIHSLGSYTNHYGNGNKDKVSVMQVVVSDLTLQRYSGITFLDALTSGIKYQ